jgi:hypothetical protein
MIGRRNSDDPARALRREMRAEANRLRSALNRTRGTPRQPMYEPITADQMRGHLGRADQVLMRIDAEHDSARRVLGTGTVTARKGGGIYRSMRELNGEAERLLTDLRAERRRLKLAWERFERTVVRTRHDSETWDALMDDLAVLRRQADALTARLRHSVTQTEPHITAATTWTPQTVRAVLTAYRDRHGRLPRKQELNSDPWLPYYTTVRRLLGPRPLSTL